MSDQPIHLAGKELGKIRHICAFFNSMDDEYKVLAPFVGQGVEQNHKIFHIVDPTQRQEHLNRLRKCDIDTDRLLESKQMEVAVWSDSYLKGNRFDQHAMIALLEETLVRSRKEGYGLCRVMGHMEWSLGGMPGVEDLVEYETRLNHVLPKYPDPVLCTYDTSRFGAAVAMDILRTHPLVLIGGTIQENPFFVQPDELLSELRGRRGGLDA